jgi:2-polyprenyl-6-methoxyphenol hydroxylase-like FAD-dependent oxidoreductase
MAPKQTVVAIVGGGPVGLVCSILLSLNGISHVLFDRQPGTAIHPKAVGINQRTMEIFRKIGVENEVLRHAAPADMSGHTAWYTSFGPRGRQIVSRDAWGGGQYQDEYEQASPSRIILLPQIRLDPILQRRASSLNPNCILFGHEVTSLDEHPDHVIVHYHKGKGVNSSEERTMSATYVLGADGGRFLAKQLNIPMRGLSDIVDMVSAHVGSR